MHILVYNYWNTATSIDQVKYAMIASCHAGSSAKYSSPYCMTSFMHSIMQNILIAFMKETMVYRCAYAVLYSAKRISLEINAAS